MKKLIIIIIVFSFYACADQWNNPGIDNVDIIRNSTGESCFYYPTHLDGPDVPDTIGVTVSLHDYDNDCSKLVIQKFFGTGPYIDNASFEYESVTTLAPNATSVTINSIDSASVMGNYFFKFAIIDKDNHSSGWWYSTVYVVNEPRLSASVASYDFGSVGVGSSSSVVITLQNTAAAGDLIFGKTVISNNTGFSVSTGTTLNSTLSPGSSWTITVSFSPATVGAKTGTLDIPYNHIDTPILSIPLTGNGI